MLLDSSRPPRLGQVGEPNEWMLARSVATRSQPLDRVPILRRDLLRSGTAYQGVRYTLRSRRQPPPHPPRCADTHCAAGGDRSCNRFSGNFRINALPIAISIPRVAVRREYLPLQCDGDHRGRRCGSLYSWSPGRAHNAADCVARGIVSRFAISTLSSCIVLPHCGFMSIRAYRSRQTGTFRFETSGCRFMSTCRDADRPEQGNERNALDSPGECRAISTESLPNVRGRRVGHGLYR